MHRVYCLGSAVALALLLLATCFVVLARPEVAFASPLLQAGDALPEGGFVADEPPVNSPDESAHSPSLAVELNSSEPWVAFVQNNRILVSKLISGADQWAQQDGALNRSLAITASSPSLDFAGSNRDVPWVAWNEAGQINAGWYNGSNWVLTPILNRDPAREAGQPALAAGATVSGSEPLPWVAWGEFTSDFVQIAVSRAVADAGAQGGFRWQAVGDPFSFAAARDATNPDLAFAGAGNTIPWVVWQEAGAGAPSRIFARRFVSNAWQTVGRQENCGATEAACALNLDPQRNAQAPRLAAGRLANETTATPWIVFAEETASGVTSIRVMRLDIGTEDDPGDDRFIPVGGSINSQCLGSANLVSQGGAYPDIYFVGNALHVAWVEQQHGRSNLFVCHLADVRPGQERWDLDSYVPINTLPVLPGSRPSLGSNGQTPYVAWQEGGDSSSVFVAHRYPARPAWAVNRPPLIWVISDTHAAAAYTAALSEEIRAALAELAAPDEMAVRSAPVTVTTTANHVHGWEEIEEIQLRLSDDDQTIFFARYVVSEDHLLVQDPDTLNFFPGIKPGPGSPNIPTRFVSVLTPAMRVVTHGAGSPALDIQWVLVFEDAAFYQDYIQLINIVYDGDQETGFFKVGEVFVGRQVQLPLVANQ